MQAAMTRAIDFANRWANRQFKGKEVRVGLLCIADVFATFVLCIQGVFPLIKPEHTLMLTTLMSITTVIYTVTLFYMLIQVTEWSVSLPHKATCEPLRWSVLLMFTLMMGLVVILTGGMTLICISGLARFATPNAIALPLAITLVYFSGFAITGYSLTWVPSIIRANAAMYRMQATTEIAL